MIQIIDQAVALKAMPANETALTTKATDSAPSPAICHASDTRKTMTLPENVALAIFSARIPPSNKAGLSYQLSRRDLYPYCQDRLGRAAQLQKLADRLT
jgi:hypothetical protein